MKIGLLINHGLEVRYYLLSKLYHTLLDSGNECFLLLQREPSGFLSEFIRLFSIEYKVLPSTNLKISRNESIARSLGNARKRATNTSIYSHYGTNMDTSRWYDFLFRLPGTSFLSDTILRKKLSKEFETEALVKFFESEKIERLYMLQYGSTFLKQVGASANKAKVDVRIFINTLKTVFIDDFVPFAFSELYSWNQEQNKLFIDGNKALSPSKFISAGSPYHNFLIEEDAELQIRILKKYGLSPLEPFIVYSLINEKIFSKEFEVLKFIMNTIKDSQLKVKPKVVIRRNPFEENEEHIQQMRNLSNVIVADHYWERDASNEWSIQGIEGEVEWRALLQMAALSMNIPSMSTIDSLLCGTPVINIAFDANGDYNNEIKFLIESPFSKEFDKSDFVATARSAQELITHLERFQEAKNKYSKQKITQSLPIQVSDIEVYAA